MDTIESYNKPEGFDTRVHLIDPKSGRLVREQHYALHIVNGRQVFERSGEYFWPNGERVSKEELLEKIPQMAPQFNLADDSAGKVPAINHITKTKSKKVEKAISAS